MVFFAHEICKVFITYGFEHTVYAYLILVCSCKLTPVQHRVMAPGLSISPGVGRRGEVQRLVCHLIDSGSCIGFHIACIHSSVLIGSITLCFYYSSSLSRFCSYNFILTLYTVESIKSWHSDKGALSALLFNFYET